MIKKTSVGFLLVGLLLTQNIPTARAVTLDSSIVPDLKNSDANSEALINDYYNRSLYWDELSLRLQGTIGIERYSQTPSGGGASTMLSPSRAIGYGGEARYRPITAWYTFYAGTRFQETPYQHSGSPFNTNLPSFSLKRKQFALGTILYPFSEFGAGRTLLENLGFGIGFGYRYRDSVNNTPIPIVTSVREFGLDLGVHYTYVINRKITAESKLGVFLPNLRYETRDFTGYNLSSFTGELNLGAAYRFVDFFELAAGFYFSMGRTKFTDRGYRGNSVTLRPNNSTEVETNYGIPIQARVYF